MAFPEYPTDEHVRALLRHQYPAEEHDAVLSLLEPVAHEGHMGWSPARIRLAALAMSNGNKSLISQWIDQGNKDCRDLQLSVRARLGPTWERDCLFDANR